MCFNLEKLKTKKYSTVLHSLPHYKYFIQKLIMDFSTNVVSTIELVINQVKKWIAFLEKMTNYPLVLNQKLPNFLIYNYDWSVIQIPTENDINVMFEIHIFILHFFNKKSNILIFVLIYIFNFYHKSLTFISSIILHSFDMYPPSKKKDLF